VSLHIETFTPHHYRAPVQPIFVNLRALENAGYEALGKAIHLAACAALVSRFKPREEFSYKRGLPPKALCLALVYTESAWANISPVAVLEDRSYHAPAVVRNHVWRVLRLLGYSLPGIGKAFRRDHSTILFGLRSIGEWWRPEHLAEEGKK
jgi:hypothetical protein